jgi:hypothetical protein
VGVIGRKAKNTNNSKSGNESVGVEGFLRPSYEIFFRLSLMFVQEFWNWFDPTAWYPLGRVVGGTVYPGLMVTSGVIYNILHALNLPVDIRNICVLLAPGFSALTAWATYMLSSEGVYDNAFLIPCPFQVHQGNERPQCGFTRCRIHWHRTWLHIPLRCRFL